MTFASIVPGRTAPTLAAYPTEPRSASRHGGTRTRIPRSHAHGAPSPIVSIITVVRNGAAVLARAIESVISQDYPMIEYIVVDGESTDRTVDVIRRFEERIAIWLSEPDRGISDAFNKGIALARGEIIGILNSDDWYEPGAIRRAVDALINSGADIAYGKFQYWDRNQKTYLVSGDANSLSKGMTIGHPSVFVRRHCYERVGLFRLDFRQAMDYEWLLRAKVNGATFCFIDNCIANMQSGGIGDRHWRESLREAAYARLLHLPNAHSAMGYRAYLFWASIKGIVRRSIDALGLSVVRRWYHRRFSPIRITVSKDSGR